MNATTGSLAPAALPVATIVRRLALFGVALGLTVVVLGAWVRLTDAGLGCPDWPTCYGHVTPSGAMQTPGQIESYSPGWAFDSGKAWREMIHRYAATTLGFVIVLITAIAIVYRRQKPVSLPFALALLGTVLLQGLLGAFTVWWLVKPLVVVLHLIGGLSTVSLLFWLWLDMRRRTGVVQPLPGGWTLTPALRLYTQSAARFYVDAGPIDSPFAPNPPEGALSYTEDQRMSAFGARTLGLKIAKQLDAARLVDVKFERYGQRAGWRLFGTGSPDLLPFNARSLQIGLSRRF